MTDKIEVTREELENIVEKKVDERLNSKDNTADTSKDAYSRRSFLKKIGAGAIGVGAMSLIPAAARVEIRDDEKFGYYGDDNIVDFSVDPSGKTVIRGLAELQGDLSVSGNTTFNNQVTAPSLTVNNTLNTADLNVSGSTNFNQDIYVQGNKVYHDGDSGSGSGIDADTIDGQHASDIADSAGGNVPVIGDGGSVVYKGSPQLNNGWSDYTYSPSFDWTYTGHDVTMDFADVYKVKIYVELDVKNFNYANEASHTYWRLKDASTGNILATSRELGTGGGTDTQYVDVHDYSGSRDYKIEVKGVNDDGDFRIVDIKVYNNQVWTDYVQ